MKRCLAAACAVTVTLAAAPALAVDLYQEQQYRPLVADARARHIGDSITVQVLETSSASASADTNTKRQTEAGIGGTWDIGPSTRTGSAKGNINNDFKGGARTQRAGRLLASLTVTVVGVEPNGDLRIAGEQVLEVNNEEQKIRLEGRVRPQDISENNAVVSSRIADARIQYVGDGVLAEGQRQGWITKALTWLGL
jgi:flagellar L-ring protein FlgH